MATIAQDIGILINKLGWTDVTASTPDCVLAVQRTNGDVDVFEDGRGAFRALLHEWALHLAATNAGVQNP